MNTEELLSRFRKTVGDITPSAAMDEYYLNFIRMAYDQLAADDVSDTVLSQSLGMDTTVLLANALMQGKDIAEDKTLVLLKNTLALKTKGERYANGD